MTKDQLRVAIPITVICTLAIAAKHIWSGFIVDEKDIFFLTLAVLPWLTLFFKKFKIPGFEAEFVDRAQGSTERLIPPAIQVLPSDQAAISEEGKKILSTLWRYQAHHFKQDYSKRWTFTVSPASPDYASFIRGLAEVINRGWVAVSPENNQCLLTNEGVHFIQQNQAIQDSGNIYLF